jgi:hypothetical protein
MSQLCNWIFSVCLVSAPVLPAAASTVKVNNWKLALIGIEETTATIDGQDASVAYATGIDLQAPGIRFYSTPHRRSQQTGTKSPLNRAEHRDQGLHTEIP